MALRQGQIRIQPMVIILKDPQSVVEDVVDQLDGRSGRPTGWMQRMRGRSAVHVTAVGQVPLYEGRACCYDHLRRFDGRPDLVLPFDTTCPGCAREFRVTLGLVRAGR